MSGKLVFLIGFVSIVFVFLTEADWQSLKPMPTPRSEMSASSVDEKIYVPGGLGGVRLFQAYAIATDHWKTLAPLPEGRHHLMTVAHNAKIYVFGGGDGNWRPTDTAWRYDLHKNRWEWLTAMPEPRYAGAAVALGDFIYVVGGTGTTGETLRYNPSNDSWKKLGSTHQRREHISAVVMDGKIMVIGGRYRGVGELNSTEIYTVETNQWKLGPVLNVARGGHAVVAHNGGIIVMGGEIIMGNGKKVLGDSERLDQLTAQWRKGWDLPQALHGLAAISHNESVYILGGSERAGAIVNRGRVYRSKD